MERCSDGGEDQGAEERYGAEEGRIITSVLEKAVSRERLFLFSELGGPHVIRRLWRVQDKAEGSEG